MSVISDLLHGVLAIDPAADVIDYDNVWHSWAEFSGAIGAIQARLGRLGLGAGARVGVVIRNRPDALAAVMAVLGLDACVVSINPLLPEDRLVSDINSLRLPVIIGEPDDFARPALFEAMRQVGTAGVEALPVFKGVQPVKGLEAVTGPAIRREDPDIIIEMLTSGTTGAPKRVPLKRTAFEHSFISAMSYERGRSAEDAPKLRSGVQLLTNPMTHIGGLWHAVTTILAGRKICLVEKFTVQSWRDAVVRHRPKVAGAVPAGLRMILDANLPREDLASLTALRTGAAPLDPAVTREFLERYGLPVLQNYGATEFAGAVAGWSLPDFKAFHESKPGSVGRFQPGVTGRVVDADSGRELAPGEEGVLEMKAAQFGNGDAWLRTTDRAVIDADGFLFIRGRADNAIIRGGFKVHPDDVVKVLESHPAVREAVVVGLPDRRLGAVPGAAIILKSGALSPSEAELTAYVKARMLPYQAPARFLFVEDVPRTNSMKPALVQVRALFEDADAAA